MLCDSRNRLVGRAECLRGDREAPSRKVLHRRLADEIHETPAQHGARHAERRAVRDTFVAAYRYQYIVSRVRDERFQSILGSTITEKHSARIGAALAPILESVDSAVALAA